MEAKNYIFLRGGIVQSRISKSFSSITHLQQMATAATLHHSLRLFLIIRKYLLHLK